MNIKIQEFTTFYKIPKIENVDYSPLLRLLSSKDYYTEEFVPYGYFEYNTHYRICKIPKDQLLRYLHICGVGATIENAGTFPYERSYEYKLLNQPRDDLQRKVIDDVLHTLSKENRCIVSLQTGRGKTYVATNVIHSLKCRALILVKSRELRNQWVSSFNTHTTCKDIFAVESGSDWLDLMENNYSPDVIISTHSGFTKFMKDQGEEAVIKLLLNKKIGMKVYDECDLENKSMFKLDTISSLRYTLYLSATMFKSSKDDDVVFQRIFWEVQDVGEKYKVTVERNGLFIHYESKPTKQEHNQCHQYSPDGMVFSYPRWHRYMILKKAWVPAMKFIWEKMIEKRFNSDEVLKTVFFIGRKDNIVKDKNTNEIKMEEKLPDMFRQELANIFNIDPKYIGILNSDTPKRDRQKIFEDYKLIISTSKSMGRGIDLKGLDIIVDLETRASQSETQQVIGRVSRVGMKNTGTYISLVDQSFETTRRNHDKKMRNGFYEQELTKIHEMDK